MTRSTTRMQDAVRILLLINEAALPLDSDNFRHHNDPALASAIGVVHTQVRLQKLDFWVRNPDYLANELLTIYENNSRNSQLLDLASEILDSEEPEIRRYPMLRHLFGAYENLEDALSILRQGNLVIRRKTGSPNHVTRSDYYLTKTGRELAQTIVKEYPDFVWYSERSKLVVQLTEGQGATAIKDRQYLVAEYKHTPHGTQIPSITAQTRRRLAEIKNNLEKKVS